MSEHTQGRLEYSSAGHGDAKGNVVTDEYFIRRPGDDVAVAADIADPETGEPSKANARRIVACWNACEGITTEALASGDLNVFDLQRDRLVLTQQRDKLLAALEKLAEVAGACEEIASSYSGTIDGVEEHGGDDHEDPSCAIFHRLYYAMFDARAAIAKAKGGAQ